MLYLLEINHTFADRFNVIDLWKNINTYCINKRLFSSMINTNIKGFEYGAIGDDDTYFSTLKAVCKDNTDYKKANAKESEQYQCFSLLLNQSPIQKLLKRDSKKMLDILQTLISSDKDALIEYLFEFVKKSGWHVDFSAPFNQTYNALTYSVYYGNVCLRLCLVFFVVFFVFFVCFTWLCGVFGVCL